jgi:hypothetical protein
MSSRIPPRPRQVPKPAFEDLPTEGYAGGASPSMDVSNTAGTGGASSYRGHGTVNPERSRYWHPDPDNEIPR